MPILQPQPIPIPSPSPTTQAPPPHGLTRFVQRRRVLHVQRPHPDGHARVRLGQRLHSQHRALAGGVGHHDGPRPLDARRVQHLQGRAEQQTDAGGA